MLIKVQQSLYFNMGYIVTFKANTAYYGGAIYIGPNNDNCVLQITSEVSGSYIFTGNDVITEGSSIYSVV